MSQDLIQSSEATLFWESIPPPVLNLTVNAIFPLVAVKEVAASAAQPPWGGGGGLECDLSHGAGGLSLRACLPGLLSILSGRSKLNESGSP